MKAIERWKQGAQLVFSEPKYRLLAAIFFLLLLPIYAILTDIVIISPLSVNPNIKLLEAFLIIMVAILASLGFTIAAYQLSMLHTVSKKSVGGSVLGAGAGGSVLATFATSCTICQPIWLVWLGFGGISAALVDYSLPIALFSIALLLFSINSGFKAIVEGCKVKLKAAR
ncbi:MAG: hypothetical protein QW568_04615 [Candidatus Anstonellaceae archaeon]